MALCREVLRDLGVQAQIDEIEVRSPEDAHRLRFLGSPSVRVNDVDVEPGAQSRTDYALSCRMYGSSAQPAPSCCGAASMQKPGSKSAAKLGCCP